MRKVATCLLAMLIVTFGLPGPALGSAEPGEGTSELRVYQVNKTVAEFPDVDDFSTPEAAYAAINRISASGERGSQWRQLAAKELRSRMPSADAEKREQVAPGMARALLNARILEVRVFRGEHGMVIAELPSVGGYGGYIDGRIMVLEDGRWLNNGSSAYPSVAEARVRFARYCGRQRRGEKPVRSPIEDPEDHLKPFVEFLRTHGEDPKAFAMKALAAHKIVIMGEVHHRPRYWAFNSSLVTEPNFPKLIGTIYMELPANGQGLVDEFLATERPDAEPVIEMLRDNLWTGWPDQPMLDFFVTVWTVNQDLPAEQRLRIVLVDMERPWKEIQKREDWQKYNVDRDAFMAKNILRDLREHPEEKRNALFIVGVGHTMLDLKYPTAYPPVDPLTSAGWHLQTELGRENVYAFFPHQPVQTNVGQVYGRLCLGLFGSAFAALGNRPVAFPLETGPFGQQPFDAMPDKRAVGTYGDGYDGYLYLGPLEHETFSPLIPEFYTDEFVQELERRTRIMWGKPWSEAYRQKPDAESFIAWMRNSWGQPRKWTRSLGPTSAWHYGDRWKEEIAEQQYPYAFEHPEVIVGDAEKLLEAIRSADYEDPGDWRDFPGGREYRVNTNYPGWMEWVCDNLKKNPIQTVELGPLLRGDGKTSFKVTSRDGTVREVRFTRVKVGLPTVSYKLTLKDGTVMEGVLPFYFDAQSSSWCGDQGLDWHLIEPKLDLSTPVEGRE